MSKKKDEFKKSMAGSLDKYVVRASKSILAGDLNVNVNDNDFNETNGDGNDANIIENVNDTMGDYGNVNRANDNSGGVNMNENVNDNDMGAETMAEVNLQEPHKYIFDPSNWGKIDQKLIDFLVENGPRRVEDFDFPSDEFGRHFSTTYYTLKMRNKEKQDRRWLIYSISSDIVFCLCCKLFSKNDNHQLVDSGFNDWNNLCGRLQRHENCQDHKDCLTMWVDLELRLKKNETIDKQFQEQINLFFIILQSQIGHMNAQNVADALQKEDNLKKTDVQKALDTLCESERITFKEYGKQKIYVARLDQFPNSEELYQRKKENAELQLDLEEEKRAISEVERGSRRVIDDEAIVMPSDGFARICKDLITTGIEEALERYRDLVPQVHLAGPTSFAPVIGATIDIVESSGRQYHVLLIIADGQVTRSSDTEIGQLSIQEQETIDAIVKSRGP